MGWEENPIPLQEQPVHLSTKPHLHARVHIFLRLHIILHLGISVEFRNK